MFELNLCFKVVEKWQYLGQVSGKKVPELAKFSSPKADVHGMFTYTLTKYQGDICCGIDAPVG